MQYFLDSQAWVEKIPDDSECRTTLHRQACAHLQEFMSKHDNLCLFWKIAPLLTSHLCYCNSAPSYFFLANPVHWRGTWDMAELLLLLAVILPVAYLLSGTSSCRCMYRANITKITVTLLVVLFVPDMGEEGEGISVSLTHYSIGQLPCRGLNESYFFFFLSRQLCLQRWLISLNVVTGW